MHKHDTIFDRFPVRALLEGPTPIHRLDRLSDRLGVNVYAKRDDVGGLGLGGNKLRKLEFLMGEALAAGADTIITVGARQSNHARLTAAAAARAGLRCELVLNRAVDRADDDYVDNGNPLLNDLLGATVHDLPGAADTLAFAEGRATQLRRAGRNVYICPLGGSSAVGCLGYAKAAHEIRAQEASLGVTFDEIVVPNGSGGTHAGLAAGEALFDGDPARVRAHAVLRGAGETRAITLAKIHETLQLLETDEDVPASALNLSDAQLGPGYGQPTEAMRLAVRSLASTEGLLLDPVYSGKAFAGLLADIEQGYYHRGQNVLFVMTGGVPGLFAYRSAF